MAVPGDVRAPGSAAPNQLLRDGCAPCTSPDDLLDALGLTARQGALPGVASSLPAEVHAALAARWPRPVRVDDLAATTGVAVGQLLAALMRARVDGEVAESAEGVRLRRAP